MEAPVLCLVLLTALNRMPLTFSFALSLSADRLLEILRSDFAENRSNF